MRNYISQMICFLIVLVEFANAQHPYERVWVLGVGKSSNPENNLRVNKLIFSNDELTINEDSLGTNILMRYTNTNISDDSGKLLLASNGYHVIGSDRETIQNGNRLVESWSTDNWSFYGFQYPQGILILNHDYDAYIFHVLIMSSDLWEGLPVNYNVMPKLYYARIECKNSICSVILKDSLIHDEILDSHLTAVKHSNDRDWWIISRKFLDNNNYFFLLDSSGINFSHEQSIGLIPSDEYVPSNGIKFSPDGTRFVRFAPVDGLEIFDFNRTTGLLSNSRNFSIPKFDSWMWGSVEFSSSGRYLYFSDPSQLYQMDLEADDWEESIVLIEEYDGYIYKRVPESPGWPVLFCELKRTPDCRIFLSGGQSTPFIHVIQEPDKPGLECRFEQRAIELPGLQYAGLPNHPNFSLGTPWEHYCDSIRTSTADPMHKSELSITVWPNPASNIVSYSWETAGAFKKAHLYDMNGRLIDSKDITGTSQSSFWLTDQAPGLYILELKSRSGELIRQKVIKQ